MLHRCVEKTQEIHTWSTPGAAGDGRVRGKGSDLVSHLDSVELAAGSPVAEGDPEPWAALGEGRGGAEGAGHAQDGTHRTGWHVLTLSWAGLHPSATGKWVQALSWFPLGWDGSDSSPWAVLTPLAAGLWQLQNLPCSQCDSMAGTCCRCACVLWLGL